MDRAELSSIRGRVDLHRHLEGCIRPRTAFELGRSQGVLGPGTSFEQFREQLVVERPLPLLDVLERFDLFRRPIVGVDAVVRITREALQDAALDHLSACELRYSPLTLARAAGLTMDELAQAVRAGVQAASEEGIATVAPLVVVISRRHGLEAAWEVVRHVERDAGATFVGVDLASDELRHRSSEYAPIAQAAAVLGLPLTVHTGEGVGAEYVGDALALPGLRRLSHAVSLADDADLVAEVVARGITVEVCPTSNVRTRIVASYAAHPARRLLTAGVRVALCSDDPTLFDIDLSHELGVAQTQMGFGVDDIHQSQRWAEAALFGASASGH